MSPYGDWRRFDLALGRLRRAGANPRGLDRSLRPCSAFGAVLEQRVAELERQVTELRTRQAGLVYILIGGLGLELLLRIWGVL